MRECACDYLLCCGCKRFCYTVLCVIYLEPRKVHDGLTHLLEHALGIEAIAFHVVNLDFHAFFTHKMSNNVQKHGSEPWQ